MIRSEKREKFDPITKEHYFIKETVIGEEIDERCETGYKVSIYDDKCMICGKDKLCVVTYTDGTEGYAGSSTSICLDCIDNGVNEHLKDYSIR